jgi:integrase/recombinase XerD
MNISIDYFLVTHREQNRIGIRFAYDKTLADRLRNNSDAQWSKTLKCWHISDSPENRKKCNIPLQSKAIIISKPTAPVTKAPLTTVALHTPLTKKAIQKYNNGVVYKARAIAACNAHVLPMAKQQLTLLAYSPSTHRTYLNEISIFLQLIGSKPADEFTADRLRGYLQYCFEKLKLSENTLHSRINALKFYYEQVLKRDKLFWEIPRPKKPLQLPKVLGERELKRLFDAAPNLKHKAILFIAYSAGLRVSEVINLRLQDIDREREQLFIHCSKGKKDRYVRLSPMVLDVLEQYYKLSTIKPTNYLFEGLVKGAPYTIRSAQQIFSDCKTKAGIIKSLSFHSLRHSFATHVLEKGVDVIFIQEILGHFDIKTTKRYLHIRRDFLINIESPLDDLYRS